MFAVTSLALWKCVSTRLWIEISTPMETGRHRLIHRCCWSSAVTCWWSRWLLFHKWKKVKLVFIKSRYRTTLLHLVKTLSVYNYQTGQFLSQYALRCVWYYAGRWNCFKGNGSPFVIAMFGHFQFVPENIQLHDAKFLCTRKLEEFVYNSGFLEYSELPSILRNKVHVEYFQERTKNAGFFIIWWIKGWKSWMFMPAPRFRTLLILKQMKKCGFARENHFDTRLFFTVESGRWNCLITD